MQNKSRVVWAHIVDFDPDEVRNDVDLLSICHGKLFHGH